MSKRVRAWHILPDNRKLRYDDGRLVTTGRTFKINQQPELCRRGFHASRKLIDAINYAKMSGCSSHIVCRVELSGSIRSRYDKLVAKSRKCLWWVDATHVLNEFALSLVKNKVSKTNFNTKLDWLNGKISTDELKHILKIYYLNITNYDFDYFLLSTNVLKLIIEYRDSYGVNNAKLEKLIWAEHKNHPRRIRNVRTINK